MNQKNRRSDAGLRSFLWTVLLIVNAPVIGTAAEVRLQKQFDARSGLLLTYPSTWHVFERGGVLSVASFTKAQSRPVYGVAQHGAEIGVLRSEQIERPIASLKDWLKLDRRNPESPVQFFDTFYFGRVEGVRIEWRQQYLPGLTGVTYYLRLPDRFIKLILMMDGDDRRAEFIRVQDQMLRYLEIGDRR